MITTKIYGQDGESNIEIYHGDNFDSVTLYATDGGSPEVQVNLHNEEAIIFAKKIISTARENIKNTVDE